MTASVAACVAFVPAILFGWIASSWLPALAAGAIWFLLLWPLSALFEGGISRLVNWASNLPFLRNF